MSPTRKPDAPARKHDRDLTEHPETDTVADDVLSWHENFDPDFTGEDTGWGDH